MTFGAGAKSFTKAFESGPKEHGLEPCATYAYASAQVGLRLEAPLPLGALRRSRDEMLADLERVLAREPLAGTPRTAQPAHCRTGAEGALHLTSRAKLP